MPSRPRKASGPLVPVELPARHRPHPRPAAAGKRPPSGITGRSDPRFRTERRNRPEAGQKRSGQPGPEQKGPSQLAPEPPAARANGGPSHQRPEPTGARASRARAEPAAHANRRLERKPVARADPATGSGAPPAAAATRPRETAARPHGAASPASAQGQTGARPRRSRPADQAPVAGERRRLSPAVIGPGPRRGQNGASTPSRKRRSKCIATLTERSRTSSRPPGSVRSRAIIRPSAPATQKQT